MQRSSPFFSKILLALFFWASSITLGIALPLASTHAGLNPSCGEFSEEPSRDLDRVRKNLWSAVHTSFKRVISPPLLLVSNTVDANFSGTKKNWASAIAQVVRGTFFQFFDLISPIKIPLRWSHPAQPTIHQFFKDSDFVLNSLERELLKKHGVYNAVLNRELTYQLTPFGRVIRPFHRLQLRSREALREFALWSALTFAISQIALDPMIPMSQYLNSEKTPLARNEIQILSQTTPFPHVSIRIGGWIYSYGQTHLYRSTPENYFRNPSPSILGLTRTTEESFRSGSLAPIEEVFQVTLPQAEVDRLEKDLLNHLGAAYRNQTHVMDCSSMIALTLRKNTSLFVPKFLDASPFLTESTLRFHQLFLKAGAIKSFLVTNTQGDPISQPALRNSVLHFLDARLYIYAPIFTFLLRSYTELTDSIWPLQEFDDQTKAVLSEFSNRAKQAVQEDIDIIRFNSRVKTVSERGNAQEKEQLLSDIDFVIELRLEEIESALQDPKIPHFDRILLEQKKLAYVGQQQIWVKALSVHVKLSENE
jgi:hypothetical protein